MQYSYYGQHGTIIRALQCHDKLDARFFQRGNFFVGYKFPSRVSELIRKGFVETAGEIDSNGKKFTLYRATNEGLAYKFQKPTFLEFIKHKLGMHVN